MSYYHLHNGEQPGSHDDKDTYKQTDEEIRPYFLDNVFKKGQFHLNFLRYMYAAQLFSPGLSGRFFPPFLFFSLSTTTGKIRIFRGPHSKGPRCLTRRP